MIYMEQSEPTKDVTNRADRENGFVVLREITEYGRNRPKYQWRVSRFGQLLDVVFSAFAAKRLIVHTMMKVAS